MVKSNESIGKLTFKLVMAGIAVSCLGAAVVAAPLSITPKNKIFGESPIAQRAAFAPLASGPAIQLGQLSGGEEEDCIKVTRVTGADGKAYATRGVVCGH
jgi:hypothetical protein